MSLLTKASLIATPTAYGDGVLNSVKPTNGDGDFDFARASAATRVNEQGLIEKERGNLLLQSNSFDTTWITTSVSVTSGQSGYDGSSDAWLLNSSAGFIYQTLSTSGVLAFSVYAKAGTADGIRLRIDEAAPVADANCYINLTDGSEIFAHSGISLDIQNIGSGWYRITFTHNATNIVNVRFYALDSSGGSTTGTIYIQDAQLEQGLVATDYIETTTTAVYEGITNDIPRINYENGIGSFLLEPQRTNLLPYSEYVGASDWLKANITTQDNVVTSPEGLVNAARIIETAVYGGHQIYDGFSATSGQAYTLSFFAKQNGRDIGVGMESSIFGSNSTYFDLTNGVVVSTNSESASIEDYGNGWFRCSVTNTANSSGSPFVYILLSNNENFTYTGDGTSGAYIYGIQAEASSYPTSYIPTYGSSVTFASETCNNAGDSDLFNDSEGVLYAEIAALVDDATFRFISIVNGTQANNQVKIGYDTTSSTLRIACRGAVTGTYVKQIPIDNILNSNKIAFKYKANDFATWINGYEYEVQLSGTSMPSGMDNLRFEDGDGTNDFYGKTKMVSTFTEALSDSELECLTSWSSFNRMATAQNYTIE